MELTFHRTIRLKRTVWIGFLCLAAAGATSAQEPGSEFDRSKRVFEKICGNCHPLKTVVAGRRSPVQWEETLIKMIDLGAKASDDEFGMALDYLIRKHGRVNVNRAPTIDIIEVLDLPKDEAKAIVAYRREHGDYADFEALSKTPGIDLEKLKELRDAVSF